MMSVSKTLLLLGAVHLSYALGALIAFRMAGM